MGQVPHGSATTTKVIRRAIQLRQESVRSLAKRYGVSPTTVQKWRKRSTTADAPMGPKEPRSTVLTAEEEAIIVAFRRHTLLPLDDCLYGLQPPHHPIVAAPLPRTARPVTSVKVVEISAGPEVAMAHAAWGGICCGSASLAGGASSVMGSSCM